MYWFIIFIYYIFYFFFIIRSTDMIKTKQRKTQSGIFLIDSDKENLSNSELQSLLVSSVRQDHNMCSMTGICPQISIKQPLRISQIKKQYTNVYIEDRSQDQECKGCKHKIQILNDTVKLLSLRVMQVETKLNLCYNKYGQIQSKVSDCQVGLQQINIQHSQIQNASKLHYSQLIQLEQFSNHKMQEIQAELAKAKSWMSKYQARDNQKICLQSRILEHKLQKFKDDCQHKIGNLIQTVECMELKQKKMIQSSRSSKQKSTIPEEPPMPPRKYFKNYTICDKTRASQSQNISFTRNSDFTR